MNLIPKPIFIIGTQRSGSNLLRLMLNESPNIAAPHPPHILKVFMPLLPLYGDLQKQENFEQLVNDVCLFVQKNPVLWEIQPQYEVILAACKENTLFEVMRQIYAQPALAKNASYFCCKSMANVEILPELSAALPDATYIYLYRDGRDVAVSFTKAFVGEKHFYAIAQQWKKDQDFALAFKGKYQPQNWFEIRYEDFILSPEKILKDLCNSLHIDYQENMMQYHKSQESQRAADSGDMWKNVVKPVLADNKNKFLKEASQAQILIFETVAGEVLEKLGYECIFPKKERIPFSQAEIAAFEAENLSLKAAIRNKVSAEELSKRKGQEDLLAEIRKR